MMNIKDWRHDTGVTRREIVDAVRSKYPKFDKYLESKVEHPESYGVRLCDGAEVILKDMVQPVSDPASANEKAEKNRRKEMQRKLKNRIQCRLSDKDFKALKRYMDNHHFDTLQDCVTHILLAHITNDKKSRKE